MNRQTAPGGTKRERIFTRFDPAEELDRLVRQGPPPDEAEAWTAYFRLVFPVARFRPRATSRGKD